MLSFYFKLFMRQLFTLKIIINDIHYQQLLNKYETQYIFIIK